MTGPDVAPAHDPAERLVGARIPAHLAVIPDGNRRWAWERGLSPIEGHRKGFEVARRLSRFARRVGIHTVTLWAFSTENWKRSPEEVAALFQLYESWILDLLPEAVEEKTQVLHIGRRHGPPLGMADEAARAGFPDGLPPPLLAAIDKIEAETAQFCDNAINLAINYGGADEIQRAFGRLLVYATQAGLDPLALDPADFLDTTGQAHPNPDLVWRTSGEYRSSGFLPLQAAYAELVFNAKYCPDIDEDDVADAILEYSARVRRFGG
ncbi:MAG: isoprenyl transferase [Actinomycetota bacterium]